MRSICKQNIYIFISTRVRDPKKPLQAPLTLNTTALSPLLYVAGAKTDVQIQKATTLLQNNSTLSPENVSSVATSDVFSKMNEIFCDTLIL